MIMTWFVIGVGSGNVRIAIVEQHYSDSTRANVVMRRKECYQKFGSKKNEMFTATFSIISLSQ